MTFTLLIGALLLYKLSRAITTIIRHNRLSKQWNCHPPPTFPNDPTGISNAKELLAANDRGELPNLLESRLKMMSKREGHPVATMQLHVLRSWMFFTSDPKNIQALLATQFKDFELGSQRYGTFVSLLGNGIFSTDGAKWEHSRALLRPQFARTQISDLDLEERHLQNMLRALPSKRDGWTDMNDLLPLFFRLTIDSASEFLFGRSVDSQLNALDGMKDQNTPEAGFVAAFEKAQEYMARAFRFNDYYWLALGRDFRKTCKICHEFIDGFVQQALDDQNKKVNEEKGLEKYVLLEALAKQTRDPAELRDQLLSILLAGRDSTASLLSFFWIMLSRDEEIFTKLRAIVLQEFGTYDNPKQITFSGLKSCTYMQWCLNETLRLFPTVPLNSRRSTRDTTLPRGGGSDGTSPIFVPKGTEVNYSVYVMHRDKRIWGEDADRFIPDRWKDRKPGFEFLPFNGGPRLVLP